MEIGIIYEPKYADTTSETMALNATEEPMLIRPKSIETTAHKPMEYSGRCVLGSTCTKFVSFGWSTVGKESVADLLDPRTPRETVITSESPSDSRSSSENGHSAENEQNQQQRCQASRESIGSQGFLENFHKCESSRRAECIWDASDAEENCNKHAKTKQTIDKHTGHQGPRDGDSCVLDLFAHVDGAIST